MEIKLTPPYILSFTLILSYDHLVFKGKFLHTICCGKCFAVTKIRIAIERVRLPIAFSHSRLHCQKHAFLRHEKWN